MLAMIFIMPARNVIYIDDALLRQKADPITQFTPDIHQLGQDMIETMHQYQGVGLAGPQIGVMKRIFVAKIPLAQPDEHDDSSLPEPVEAETVVLINPKIVDASTTTVEGEEGCLSIPGWRGLVERLQWIKVKAQDPAGNHLEMTAEGYLARIFLHEMDHLDGILYIDHISDKEKLWKIEAEPST